MVRTKLRKFVCILLTLAMMLGMIVGASAGVDVPADGEMQYDPILLEYLEETLTYEEAYMSENRRNFLYLMESGYNNNMLRQRFRELFGTNYSGAYIFHNYRSIFGLYDDEVINDAFLRVISGYRVDFRFQEADNHSRHDMDAFGLDFDDTIIDSYGRVLVFPDSHVSEEAASEFDAAEFRATEFDISEFYDVIMERMLSLPVPEALASFDTLDIQDDAGVEERTQDIEAFSGLNSLVSLNFVSRTPVSVTFDVWYANNNANLNFLDKFNPRNNSWTVLLHGGTQPAAVSQRYTATNLSPNTPYFFCSIHI
ncbi:MAG: hypothetical protein FWD05_14370 [Oscillospiraceae bacterium]|nr:hypothetical protein [Oscillospiraceae bacterium]